MRILRTTLPILCAGLLICLTLFSCEKKDKPDPAPEPPTVLTEARLAGKWEVMAVRIVDYKNDTLLGKYEFVNGVGGIQDEQRVGSEPWLWQYHTTYLIFQDGHSFYHTDIDGLPDGYMLTDFLPYQGGSWSVLNTERMELTTKDFVDGKRPDRQLTWEVIAFNGSYISMGTMDTATVDGARYKAYLALELERR